MDLLSDKDLRMAYAQAGIPRVLWNVTLPHFGSIGVTLRSYIKSRQFHDDCGNGVGALLEAEDVTYQKDLFFVFAKELILCGFPVTCLSFEHVIHDMENSSESIDWFDGRAQLFLYAYGSISDIAERDILMLTKFCTHRFRMGYVTHYSFNRVLTSYNNLPTNLTRTITNTNRKFLGV